MQFPNYLKNESLIGSSLAAEERERERETTTTRTALELELELPLELEQTRQGECILKPAASRCSFPSDASPSDCSILILILEVSSLHASLGVLVLLLSLLSQSGNSSQRFPLTFAATHQRISKVLWSLSEIDSTTRPV